LARFALRSDHLEFEWIGPEPAEAPTVVFLHEGLGSMSMWRDFPASLAAATDCGALVYSRLGHGRSDPIAMPRTADFMHREALDTLPRVLDHFRIPNPILFGHSDGASIALIYSGARIGPVRGLVLVAPHVFVEDRTIDGVTRMRDAYANTDLPRRLERYHGTNTEEMFRAWNDVWLDPEFRAWNIEASLSGVDCPLLLIQGEEDEHGTLRQLDAIERQVKGPAERLVLPRCGHSPHRGQPQAVLDAAARFIKRLTAPRT
jgi:pimeloyl-ACP methyl ester carboxylesterase